MIYYTKNTKEILFMAINITVLSINLCIMCITYMCLSKSLNRKFMIVNHQ
jgi:hypothetical protein